jgi:hypothetical protein
VRRQCQEPASTKPYSKKQEAFIEEENEYKHVEIISVAAMAAILIFVAWILGRQHCEDSRSRKNSRLPLDCYILLSSLPTAIYSWNYYKETAGIESLSTLVNNIFKRFFLVQVFNVE